MNDARTGEAFVLVSLQPSSGPTGETDKDWMHYKIAQGKNIIDGYRRGNDAAVRAHVEHIVFTLNERRIPHRGRTSINLGTSPGRS